MRIKMKKNNDAKKMYRNKNEDCKLNLNEFKSLINSCKDIVILDVRSTQEFLEWHIDNAINIPEYEISKRIEEIIKDKNTEIIIYCQHGIRSEKAYKKLKKIGYSNIFILENGIDYF